MTNAQSDLEIGRHGPGRAGAAAEQVGKVMAQQFTLETSGRVAGDYAGLTVWYEFGDLSPFAQGYVEALLRDYGHVCEGRPRGSGEHPMLRSMIMAHRQAAFSDLHPEALAMILRDCEWAESFLSQGNMFARGLVKSEGERFWQTRKAGEWVSGRPAPVTFKPLTIYLDDAGKVRLEVAE